MEALRQGHGFIDQPSYCHALRRRELVVVVFSNQCAALLSCVSVPDGSTLNILTTTGTLEKCAEALPALERWAKQQGFHSIMSVGHVGWKRVVEKQGYQTWPKLLMHKVLT